MSQIYVPGPAGIALAWSAGSGGGAGFLGWSESGVDIQFQAFKRDVKCDLTADAPIDTLLTGETALISFTLNWYNESVLRVAQARPGSASVPHAAGGGGATVRGTWLSGHYGTLAVTEGAAPTLFISMPYAAKAAFGGTVGGGATAGNALPSGYRFLRCVLQPDSMRLSSSSPRAIRMAWVAYPLAVLASASSSGGGSLSATSSSGGATGLGAVAGAGAIAGAAGAGGVIAGLYDEDISMMPAIS